MVAVVYKPSIHGMLELTRDPTGPIGRDLKKRGIRLEYLAKKQVGKKTGVLAVSIRNEVQQASTGLLVKVGSDHKLALMHHNGTRAHVIRPRRARALRFVHNGRIVYARRVWHPGTKPNRYLTDNLFRVVLT